MDDFLISDVPGIRICSTLSNTYLTTKNKSIQIKFPDD